MQIFEAIGKWLISIIGLLGITFLLFHLVPNGSEDGQIKSQVPDFLHWLGSFSRGLGFSSLYNVPVWEIIKESFRWTFLIAIFAFGFNLLVLPLAVRIHLRKLNYLGNFLTVISLIPKYFWGLLLLFFFVSILKLFSPLIFVRMEWCSWENIYLLVPAFCLAWPNTGFLLQQLLKEFKRLSSLDYARAARAKGMSEKEVLYAQILRPSLYTLVTSYSHIFPTYLIGSVLVEKIFGISGIGTLLIESMLARDFELMLGLTFFCGVIMTTIYLFSEYLLKIIDVRTE